MALPLPRDASVIISFAIYKPRKRHDINDAIACISKAITSLEQAGDIETAILKTIDGSWAAVFSMWKGGPNVDDSAKNLPAAAVFSVWKECELKVDYCTQNIPGAAELAAKLSSIVTKKESGLFKFSCEEHKDVSFAQLRVGDIVSIRRICSSSKKQDVLAYCCLAVLKAYFSCVKGILSSTFYRSLDGEWIIGLGVWDGIESASALLDISTPSPGEVYWKGLGAHVVKYEVCQVVYVTTSTNCLVRQTV